MNNFAIIGARFVALPAFLISDGKANVVTPPAAYGAVPSPAQVLHHEREFYTFCHFTNNTFTGVEWGSGAEDPKTFNPSQFDANQIVKALKASGAKGVILTCKHHDGFCLWPTKTTTHNVSRSPFREGKGDIVMEFAKACRANNFEFGVYVSPWDRNNEKYGTPEYVTEVFQKQIQELTTQYGKIFELWFDGANGGSGYYGGKNGSRSIDADTYYRWAETEKIGAEKQPNLIIFSDVGPGVRWVGNERGHAPDPCRATITYSPPRSNFTTALLASGTLGGKSWIAAEVDVSIRAGWFFHAEQEPRSPEDLVNIYLGSVGHGALLNLNCPPDKRGLIPENDTESLRQMGEHLRRTFATNLASGAKLLASNVRGGSNSQYGPEKMLDVDRWSAWVTDDDVTTPEVVFDLGGEKNFNLIRLREDIRLGLRLEGVSVDAWVDGKWQEIAKAESIGSCRFWRVPQMNASKVRIRVTKSPVCPALSDFGLFLEPAFEKWVLPIPSASEVKSKWKIASTSFDISGSAAKAIDGMAGTLWHTYGDDGEHKLPQEIVVDMGEVKNLQGFTYTPRQDGTYNGMVDRYEFFTSKDNRSWEKAAAGEFGNLRANPVETSVNFPPRTARYFKFVATHTLALNHAAVAEIGVLEVKRK